MTCRRQRRRKDADGHAIASRARVPRALSPASVGDGEDIARRVAVGTCARDADRGRMREAPSPARERLQIMSSSEDEDEDDAAARRAIAGLGKRATFIRACETIARCARRGETRETGANVDRSKETLGRAVTKISSTLRSRYGADAVEAWASGLRACEACAEALGDEEAVEAVEALRASTPTANAREDADAGRRKATTTTTREGEELEEEVRDLTLGGRALRMLLEARRRASSEEAEAPVDETAAARTRASAATVSVEALQFRRPTSMESETACAICYEGLESANGGRVVTMPCDASHVFHEGCIKQWLLGHDDSCPLCRRALPVWLGRPQYS